MCYACVRFAYARRPCCKSLSEAFRGEPSLKLFSRSKASEYPQFSQFKTIPLSFQLRLLRIDNRITCIRRVTLLAQYLRVFSLYLCRGSEFPGLGLTVYDDCFKVDFLLILGRCSIYQMENNRKLCTMKI